VIIPLNEYNGLTVVLSNPSRFDVENKTLLSGNAGTFVKYVALGKTTFEAAYVMDCFKEKPALPGNTRVVLLCGHRAVRLYAPELLMRRGVGIHSLRGAPFKKDGVIYVPTYSPQECFDLDNYEKLKNPLLNGEAADFMYLDDTKDLDEEAEEADTKETKDLTNTRRSSWRYWLAQDIYKAKGLLSRDIEEALPSGSIAPGMEEAIALLRCDGLLYLDIETDISHNLTCIGLANDTGDVLVVPLLRHDYNLAYDPLDIGRFFQALQEAFTRRTIVIHNSLFDLFVLAYKYSITPPRRVYDTMLAQYRISPETEKSLGHCISLYTDFPYHKDEGIFMPFNDDQSQLLYAYNAKDIYTMRLIKQRQDKIVEGDLRLQASIAEANASVTPYLINSLRGMSADLPAIVAHGKINDELILQHYQRTINILVGPTVKLLPSSSQSCAKYLHDILGYKAVAHTDKGAPYVNERALYQIALSHPENVVIPFIIAYRKLLKENAIQKIQLWRTPKDEAKFCTTSAQRYTQPIYIEKMDHLCIQQGPPIDPCGPPIIHRS